MTAPKAAGPVRRQPSAEDRRVVRAAATAAAKRRLEQGRAVRVRMIAQLLDGASDAELAALRRAARLVAGRLAR